MAPVVDRASRTYSAQATTLFSAMSVAPTPTRKAAIDTLIGALKSAGVWAELDAFYLHAAHDEQAARINWKNPGTFTCVNVNSATFDVDRGFTGNGTTMYLTTGFVPASHAVNMLQNDNHHASYALNDIINTNVVSFGGPNETICFRSATDTLIVRDAASASNSTTATVATGVGYVLASRSASSGFSIYKNGSLFEAATRTSTGLSPAGSLGYMILARNSGSDVAFGISSYQVACTHFGGGLNGTQVSAAYTAINAYLQAVGAA